MCPKFDGLLGPENRGLTGVCCAALAEVALRIDQTSGDDVEPTFDGRTEGGGKVGLDVLDAAFHGGEDEAELLESIFDLPSASGARDVCVVMNELVEKCEFVGREPLAGGDPCRVERHEARRPVVSAAIFP